MKKNFLLIMLAAAFVFSCKFPTADSVDMSGLNAAINKKYPYFDVRIKEFKIDDYSNHTPEEWEIIKNMKFTAKEKEHVIRALALARFAVNTPEFEDMVMKSPNMYSHKPGEVQGGAWNITGNQTWNKPLDRQRLTEIIRGAKYSITFLKLAWRNRYNGSLGKQLAYAYHGYQPYKAGDRIGGGYDLIENHNGLVTEAWTAQSIFHEAMHNLGFDHIYVNIVDVPTKLGTELFQQLTKDIAEGSLKAKYAQDLAELTDYYLKIHRHLIK